MTGMVSRSGAALTGAQRSAAAATAARSSAQATHAASVRHLTAIRGAGIVRRTSSRVTGATGRAERSVRTSRAQLDRAMAAERSAMAQRAAAEARHARHVSAQDGLHQTSTRLGQAGVAIDAGVETVGVVVDSPVMAAVFPGGAAVHSVAIDVSNTVDWFQEQGALDQARQDGAGIDAQPITVP